MVRGQIPPNTHQTQAGRSNISFLGRLSLNSSYVSIWFVLGDQSTWSPWLIIPGICFVMMTNFMLDKVITFCIQSNFNIGDSIMLFYNTFWSLLSTKTQEQKWGMGGVGGAIFHRCWLGDNNLPIPPGSEPTPSPLSHTLQKMSYRRGGLFLIT